MSRYLVNARNRAESTEPSRFPPPHVEVCLFGSQHACRIFERAITQPTVRDDPWHYVDQSSIRALTSALAFAAATCRAGLHASRRRSLNILTAREPMGLSLRHWLILLASHGMALTRERKNSSRIAREIKKFQFLLGWSPRWSRSITQGFKLSAAQSVDHDDWLTFMKYLVERKSQFPSVRWVSRRFWKSSL